MNQMRTIVLLGVVTVVLLAIGGSLGPGYLYGCTAFALLVNFGPIAHMARIADIRS